MDKPYATTQELANHMQVLLADLPIGAAQALDLASGAVERYAPGVADVVSDSEVKRVTLQVAARHLFNPAAAASETIGSYAITYTDPNGFTLTVEEARALGRYHNGAGTLTMSPNLGTEFEVFPL